MKKQALMTQALLAVAAMFTLANPADAQAVRNGLPPTSMDSFVRNAGAHAEAIYGDEGKDGIPEYEHFTQAHRINTGIVGVRDAGLTTGHGSMMPSAWGGDEFSMSGPEFSQSGANFSGFDFPGLPIPIPPIPVPTGAFPLPLPIPGAGLPVPPGVPLFGQEPGLPGLPPLPGLGDIQPPLPQPSGPIPLPGF